MSLFLLILTIICSVLFGFLALSISFALQRKYELNYVKSYFYHQILIFLFGFYGLLGTIITHYFLIDVEINSNILKYLPSFLPFIGIPFMIAAWYLFIKISFEIIEKKISLRFTLLFFVVLLLVFLIFGFLLPYVEYFTVEQSQINTHVLLIFILIELLTLVLVFYNYFVLGQKLKEKHKIKFIRVFATVNLVLYVFSMLLLVLGEMHIEFISSYTIIYFSKDIIPLFLLKKYLKANYVHPVNLIEETRKDSFIQKYSISKRESEIVEEIVMGKTNKEISERLFISLQTVKDHVHNIYLKTEVKNRVQLTNLIRQYNK